MNNENRIDFENLVQSYKQHKAKFIQSWIARYIAEILLNLGSQHRSEAQDWIINAIEFDTANGMQWSLAQDYRLYSEFYRRQDASGKAGENLAKAIEIFKACGADGWVEKAQKEYARL